jgi:hypothetical protein
MLGAFLPWESRRKVLFLTWEKSTFLPLDILPWYCATIGTWSLRSKYEGHQRVGTTLSNRLFMGDRGSGDALPRNENSNIFPPFLHFSLDKQLAMAVLFNHD